MVRKVGGELKVGAESSVKVEGFQVIWTATGEIWTATGEIWTATGEIWLGVKSTA